VEFLAAGATGLVAEGNEGAVVSFLGDEHESNGLLETFENSLGKRTTRPHTATGDRDPVTRLRGESALESRLAATHGPVPRLAFARLVGLDDATRRLSVEARELLRRRIALQCDQVCRHFSAEIFATAPGEFAIVADHLGAAEFERLGRELVERVRGYTPDRAAPLRLAIGHAGPEAAGAIDSLRELALRGVDLASRLSDETIVSAEKLTISLAATTELDTMLRAVALVEERDAYPGSHGERVAQTAVAVGEAMDLGTQRLMKLRLAGRLHDVGKLDLDDGIVAGTIDTLQGEQLAKYQTHPRRGAAMLRANAGHEVAELVASYHERWDGTGFPDGLEGTAIPLGARILSAADALDRWSVNGSAPERPGSAAVEKLREGSGTWFDPAVVEACVDVFGNA
jgi:HD-GYP domain-containing protein (c-di-GMP phosphodiesterase class II)